MAEKIPVYSEFVDSCHQQPVTPKNAANEFSDHCHGQRAPIRKRKRSSTTKDDCSCLHKRITKALYRADCEPEDELRQFYNPKEVSCEVDCIRSRSRSYGTHVRRQEDSKPTSKLPHDSSAVLDASLALAHICDTGNIAQNSLLGGTKRSSLELGPLL